MMRDSDEFRLDFRADGNAAPFCRDGWSGPEPTETWTLGHASHLVLPAPTRPDSYVLALRFRPHVAGPALPAQRLTVLVNGVEVAAFRIAEKTRRACLIPWAAIAIDGTPALRLEFRLPDAARPADVGGGADARLLGLAFTALLLYPARQPAFPDRDGPLPADPALAARAQALPPRDLMLQFESLGENCEFGLAQRQCGAEPLGLLRFASTPLPLLLDALEARFDGMGSPEHTAVEISADGKEYMIKDWRFGFLYHTWVPIGEMTAEAVGRREIRRVPFLVRKLLDDLATAEKIFVVKGMGAMPEEEVFPLAMAIRRYGANTLLFVTLADADHPGGTVVEEYPGFLVGYIDRFAPGANAHDLLLDQWLQLCREAYRLRLAADASTARAAA